MTSAENNVETLPEPGKGEWPVVGGRVHPEHRRMLDVAAGYLGKNRSDLIVEAALARAKEVLVEHGVPLEQFNATG